MGGEVLRPAELAKIRNGISADGKRSVMVTSNTESLERRPGVPAPVGEVTRQLMDNTLCPSPSAPP